jgi:hypothetical protein
MMDTGEPENGKRFFPSGAIFFFALLILFYAALWQVMIAYCVLQLSVLR